MNLLLTSGGLTTKIIKDKFICLLLKPIADTKVLFVNTASKVEEDNSYMLKDLAVLKELGITNIYQVDISDTNSDWLVKMRECDVIWVAGGNTFYLLDQVRKSGFDLELKKALESKIYVGVSAGSIIVTPSIAVANIEPADINVPNLKDLSALSLVDFEISPHTYSMVSAENIKNYSLSTTNKIYAIGDDTALLYTNSNLEIIGNKQVLIFNS